MQNTTNPTTRRSSRLHPLVSPRRQAKNAKRPRPNPKIPPPPPRAPNRSERANRNNNRNRSERANRNNNRTSSSTMHAAKKTRLPIQRSSRKTLPIVLRSINPTKQRRVVRFVGTGKWRAYDEESLLVGTSTEGDCIIQCASSRLYAVSPNAWKKRDAARARSLSSRETKQCLELMESETNRAIVQKKENEKRRVKERIQEAKTTKLAAIKAITAGQSYKDPTLSSDLENIKQHFFNSVILCATNSSLLVDAMVHHLAIINNGNENVQLIYTVGKKFFSDQATFMGLFAFNGIDVPDGDDDTPDAGRLAYVFMTKEDGARRRILPENMKKSLLGLREFNVQPQNTNQRSTIALSSSSNRLNRVSLEDLTVNKVSQMQKNGHFDRKKATEGESPAEVVTRGVVAIVRQNRDNQKTIKLEAKKMYNSFLKDVAKAREQAEDRRLEIEKEVIIGITEPKMKEFLESDDSKPSNNLFDELATEFKAKAPSMWKTYSILGHAKRDGRNIKDTPANKDRKIARTILFTIRGGNQKLLPYFALFMAMVYLCEGDSYASLDRRAKQGQCCESQTVLKFMRSRLKDYTTFQYGDKIRILWDNVNLYVRKKFGSTHDGSESALQHSSVTIVLKNTCDPEGTLSTTTKSPNYQQIAEHIDSDPYSLETTKSGAKVPEEHPYWKMYPKVVQDLILKEEDDLMLKEESSQERLDVGRCTWYMDQVVHLFQFIDQGTDAFVDSNSPLCTALGVSSSLLKKIKQLKESLTAQHSVSAKGYANQPDKKRVHENPVRILDSTVMSENEMSISGTVCIMRTLFGRTNIGLSHRDIFNILKGGDIKMTIYVSGDQGSQQLIESVLMRCVLGMKSLNFQIALYCAQVYVMIISSAHRGDPLHEYLIHGTQSMYKAFFPNGLHAVTTGIQTKSISPERSKDAQERHNVVLESIARGRLFIVLLKLIDTDVLQSCVVKKGAHSYIDPGRFMAAMKNHLNGGGESFKQQGKHFLEHVAALFAAMQSIRHLDTTMLDVYTKWSICLHKKLGKTYASRLASEIEARHFWSPYMERVYQIDSTFYLHGESGSTGGVCLGEVIENLGVKHAKQRDSVVHQHLLCSNSQLIRDCHRTMYVGKDPPRTKLLNHRRTPKHNLQMQRIVELYLKSGVTVPNDTPAEMGVGAMWTVTETFLKQDEAARVEKKKLLESEMESESEKSSGLAGSSHTSAEEKRFKLMLKDINNNHGDGDVWGKTEAIPKPPKERTPFNKRYINIREGWSTDKESLFSRNRKKIHRIRSYLIQEGIECFLRTHCSAMDAEEAGQTIKEEDVESLLPEIRIDDLDENAKQWYSAVMAGFEPDAMYEAQEYVGE